jgi:pSer/pThr/pTyr-binding forkhead associated (FHA) protein
MQARLVPLDGSPPIELTHDVSVVGRRDDADVRVDHKSVSKQHCVVVRTANLLHLRDLGSTNGTRVNGQRVRRAELHDDDEVAIAGVKFRVAIGRPDAHPASNRTQHLKPEEVAALAQREPAAATPREPRVVLHTHELPDVYPPDSDAEPAT